MLDFALSRMRISRLESRASNQLKQDLRTGLPIPRGVETEESKYFERDESREKNPA
jgi:hypothetical protein